MNANRDGIHAKYERNFRFAGWLEEARENLAQIVLEEGLDNEQCPELVPCKESAESEQRGEDVFLFVL
ncbi:unnamed protein product [Anisakis simplex]|uniref:HEPN domain-containing protein n=1 Tax=Anisakis simplex TaxID=6269 RepID=A0A0M3JJ94_ANISI|nr:unnamed protein product [Anisakis simplex]